MRSRSGAHSEHFLHRHVLDPGLDKHLASWPVADARVQLPRVRLGVQDQTLGSQRPALGIGPLEQLCRDPLTAGIGPDRQPAELDGVADVQQPAGADKLAVGDGHQMDAFLVAAVELLELGDALLPAEDLVPERERLLYLIVPARAADLVGDKRPLPTA